MKMNKKGFTLIEMLVVIAIIAVLVSIVIPTVASSTDKAGAATNAANLRAIVAEATTKMLASDSTAGNVTLTFTDGVVSGIAISDDAPKSAKVGACPKGKGITLTWDATNGFKAYYGTYSLASFTAVADGSKAASELATDAPSTAQGVVKGTGADAT